MVSEEKLREFIQISDQLNHLLDQENALLRQRKLADIRALQESKTVLSQIYAELSEHMYEQLKTAPDQFSDSVRMELRKRTEQFYSAAAENKDWLRAALMVNQRVIEAVAEAVLEAESDPDIYIDNGTMNDGKKNAVVHMSLNQLA